MAIEYTTQIQQSYIENPEYLYWRGKILIYNGNSEMGKKFIQSALSKDPDNATFAKAWRNLLKMERLKKEGMTCLITE